VVSAEHVLFAFDDVVVERDGLDETHRA